ncbi:MAG: hypothetical protein ACYT04_82450 [Nostoc sp.]
MCNFTLNWYKTYAEVYGITNHRGAEDTWQIILRSLLTNSQSKQIVFKLYFFTIHLQHYLN